MSYIALARQWRPRTFSQLIGQEHVSKALIYSLENQRVHHAYLFTGMHGVGKTSVARLLAKAMNCEQGMRAEPCLVCDTCLAIEEGRSLDLIEVDAASRTRVEDTRDLLENVHYIPTSARFKIYLIDEVHMLSQHSFNALLKTLEEPPAHVKFLLATTDPQKLPSTVLSRCLQFHLSHISDELIITHLRDILLAEQRSYDEAALSVLAEAARGSMRDALSLLDQAIAVCEKGLNVSDVKQMLGYTRQNFSLQLLQALAELNADAVVRISREIQKEGGQYRYVLEALIRDLHQLSLMHWSDELIDSYPGLTSFKNVFSLEDLQLFYSIVLHGLETLDLAPSLTIGFDMTILRMHVFRPATPQKTPILAYQTKTHLINEAERVGNTTENSSAQSISLSWNEIVPQLDLTGLALTAVEHMEFVDKKEGSVLLYLAKRHETLLTKTVVERITKALSTYYKETIKLDIQAKETTVSSPSQEKVKIQQLQREEAKSALAEDPFFKQLKEVFSMESAEDYTKVR